MPPEIAQQLRDIHEPGVPGHWPLTVSWWILFGLILLLLIALVVWYLWRRHQLVPYKRIRKSALALTQQRESELIDGFTYASSVNLLYKELLLDVENRTDSIVAFGDSWLALLAARFNHTGFVQGPGECLGDARFKKVSFSDEGLTGLVQSTLLRAKPTKTDNNA